MYFSWISTSLSNIETTFLHSIGDIFSFVIQQGLLDAQKVSQFHSGDRTTTTDVYLKLPSLYCTIQEEKPARLVVVYILTSLNTFECLL